VIRRALVTGFEPFGENAANPSAELALSLDGETAGGLHIAGRVLPVEYGTSGDLLLGWIRDLRPERVICCGLASASRAIRVESIAFNLDDSPFPDNAGVVRENARICATAPDSLPATLPVERVITECSERGIPVDSSIDAGRYVCNHVFFRLMNEVLEARLPIAAGFIHLPPDLPLAVMREALHIALSTE
jgi:pyroglutamyl-peptidase